MINRVNDWGLIVAAFSKASLCLKGMNATINRNNSPIRGKVRAAGPHQESDSGLLLMD